MKYRTMGMQRMYRPGWISLALPVKTLMMMLAMMPAPMLAACAKLGLQPEECLCVGDSPFDLQSGRSAGAKTVAVRYTAFGWEKLLEDGRPDFVIARPQELLELVGKIR